MASLVSAGACTNIIGDGCQLGDEDQQLVGIQFCERLVELLIKEGGPDCRPAPQFRHDLPLGAIQVGQAQVFDCHAQAAHQVVVAVVQPGMQGLERRNPPLMLMARSASRLAASASTLAAAIVLVIQLTGVGSAEHSARSVRGHRRDQSLPSPCAQADAQRGL